MPNNVYIGSRYVPKFDGAWSSIKTYEPLTIVEYGNNSFTSKRPVPLNTPPTTGDDNDLYWALTGNYNGQISNLQNQINTNASNITALAGKVAIFDGNALNTNFSNRKIVFLGDSYNFSEGGWLSKLVARLSLDSANVYDYTVSGHGFNNGQWLGDITSFVNGHSDIVNDITDIIIIGGVNDSTESALSSLNSQIDAFVGYVATNLPNAFISVAFVGSAKQQSSVLADRTYPRRMKALAIYSQKLNKKNCRLLAGTFNALCQYTLFVSDGLHPNSYGNDRIVDSVAQALLSGKADMVVGDINANTSQLYGVDSGVINDFSYLNIDQWLVPTWKQP